MIEATLANTPALPTELVTCSYGPDRERCVRLCATVDRYLPESMGHLIIVPRRDFAAFRELEGGRRRVVTVEETLPRRYHQLPSIQKWWIGPTGRPVRGWICQQLTKIAVNRVSDAQVWVFCDSDVRFIRPLDVGRLIVGEGASARVRLHRIPGLGDGPRHLKWNRASGEMLGLPVRDYYGYDYIAQLVCWRRDTLEAMHEHLERQGGRPWDAIIAARLHFSEYVLYGIFADFLLDEHAGHFSDPQDLCHSSWHYDFEAPDALERFIDELTPEHAAVLVQSYLPFADHRIDAALENVLPGCLVMPEARSAVTP